MDRNFEDKIAKMAFGELTEAEAREIKAHTAANADAAKALSEYEALKGDLRRMRDVPPDQLSKERLQTAILTQGLRPKPVRRAFPWAWASSAVMIGALALVVWTKTSQVPQGTGDVVMDFTPQNSILGPGDNQLLNQPVTGFGEDSGAVATQAPPSIQVPSITAAAVVNQDPITPAMEGKPKRFHSRESFRVFHNQTARGYDRAVSQEPVLKAETFGPVEPAKAAKKEPETLVLIKSDKDKATGASNAVEVHQTQDVIVSS
jgi:hypothetical protein